MLKFGEGITHTDSQSIMDYMALAVNASTPWEFAACEHMDVLYQVWLRRNDIHNTLVRVKAHVALTTIQEPLQRYWSMGNSLVNDAAKQACQYLQPALVRELESMHTDIMQARKQLSRDFSLHLELQMVRALADAARKGDCAKSQNAHEAVVNAFSNWTVEPCKCTSLLHDVQFLEHSSC